MTLDAELIMKLHVICEMNMDVKNDGSGYLRVIPIVGGTFEGEIRGTIVPGGADWSTAGEYDVSHVFAKYLLKTEDGEYIAVENEGKITGSNHSKIKTSPRFQADAKGRYSWLNSGVYAASLEAGQGEGQVEIEIYRLK